MKVSESVHALLCRNEGFWKCTCTGIQNGSVHALVYRNEGFWKCTCTGIQKWRFLEVYMHWHAEMKVSGSLHALVYRNEGFWKCTCTGIEKWRFLEVYMHWYTEIKVSGSVHALVYRNEGFWKCTCTGIQKWRFLEVCMHWYTEMKEDSTKHQAERGYQDQKWNLLKLQVTGQINVKETVIKEWKIQPIVRSVQNYWIKWKCLRIMGEKENTKRLYEHKVENSRKPIKEMA